LLYDDVAFCRFVRGGSFSSFGLHEFVVAFCCRIVRLVCGMIIMLHFAGFSYPLGCMICCILLSGL
jgi:hypothetical protein